MVFVLASDQSSDSNVAWDHFPEEIYEFLNLLLWKRNIFIVSPIFTLKNLLVGLTTEVSFNLVESTVFIWLVSSKEQVLHHLIFEEFHEILFIWLLTKDFSQYFWILREELG